MPLLQEYFFDDYQNIRLVLGDNRKANSEEQFIIARNHDYGELFGDMELDLETESDYEINVSAFDSIEAYSFI